MLIEARWINEDDAWSKELELSSSNRVVKLSPEQMAQLKSDGSLAVSLPEDLALKSLAKVRVLIRVQISSDRLEKAFASESWEFGQEQKEVRITRQGASAGVSSPIQEALVSIHVVLEEKLD